MTALRLLIASALLSAAPGLRAAPIQPNSPTWPHPVPARVKDDANRDLFMMTLGPVKTRAAQGLYDPATDRMVLNDGTVIPDYYRVRLKLPFYQPLNKTIFPLPPSGLCTWYYYYQDVSETEVERNTDWIALNLRDYGAQYVQIDDGWQGEKADGSHGSRDWTTVDQAFPGGMAKLAAYIKSRGLIPGLWLAPHGQSKESVVKDHPGVFLLKPDGASASETWEGKWLVDPSAPATHAYLREMFTQFTAWGYEYFKIDGQPIVVEEYKKTGAFMQKPAAAEKLYRKTLETIRGAIGPRRYLLGCWGIPEQGMGLMDGSRTGGDIVRGWSGFLTALECTMQFYYQHNIAWYADPDVLLVRAPLSLDQARVWATLQGLTGQALFASDRLMDLSADRVELLRRVFPAVDIRPLDLFPSLRQKRIWDLKIDHLGRAYDVVGAFNFTEGRSELVHLDWQELALPTSGPVHIFDFWNEEYCGAWEAGFAVELPPTSCRVLTLLPDNGQIQLVSTNRHLTQGWVDLQKIESTAEEISGVSLVIKDDPYALHFAFPRGKNFAVVSATAQGPAGELPVQIANHQGWATVRFTAPITASVAWRVRFAPAVSYQYPTHTPTEVRAEFASLDGATLAWNDEYYLNAGYQVYLDGRLLGCTGTPRFPLLRLDPHRTYTAEVRSVWDDASIGPKHKKAQRAFTLAALLPATLPLASLEPVSTGSPGLPVRTAIVGGLPRAKALTAQPGADLEYETHGLYGAFTAQVAFDDSDKDQRAVNFAVLADGVEVWKGGPIKRSAGPLLVKAPLNGAKRLALRASVSDTTPADQAWWSGPRAVWLDASLSQSAPAK